MTTLISKESESLPPKDEHLQALKPSISESSMIKKKVTDSESFSVEVFMIGFQNTNINYWITKGLLLQIRSNMNPSLHPEHLILEITSNHRCSEPLGDQHWDQGMQSLLNSWARQKSDICPPVTRNSPFCQLMVWGPGGLHSLKGIVRYKGDPYRIPKPPGPKPPTNYWLMLLLTLENIFSTKSTWRNFKDLQKVHVFSPPPTCKQTCSFIQCRHLEAWTIKPE